MDIHLIGSMTVQKLKEDADALNNKSSLLSFQSNRGHPNASAKSTAKTRCEVDEVTKSTKMFAASAVAVRMQSKSHSINTACTSNFDNNESPVDGFEHTTTKSETVKWKAMKRTHST